MLRYLVRRLLLLVPILLGVSILIFFWVRALPGSPADALLGERATPALVKQYRHLYGFDRPIYVQYWKYLGTLAHGDLGVSIADHRHVAREIGDRFPATMELATAAMLFSIVLGIPLGFFAAKRHGGLFDQSSLVVSLFGISIPIFVLAILLKYAFAVHWHLLPSVGRIDIRSDVHHPTNFYILDALLAHDWHTLWDVLKHLVLPSIALGSIPLAVLMRITRGAVLTETVFAYPGMGSWLRDAIFNRDYPVLQGGVLFLAVVFVLVNLIVDISYALINPRIRYS